MDELVGVVVERLDHREDVLEVRREVILRRGHHLRADHRELPQCGERIHDVLAVVVEDLDRTRQRVQRAAQAVLALGQDRGEAVQPVHGPDDVGGLLVQGLGELGQPRDEVHELPGPPGDRGVGLVGDVLQRTEIALVHHQAQRRQHLFGGRVPAGVHQRNLRARLEPAFRSLVDGVRQLHVLRTQQRRLGDLRPGVRRQLHVTVDRQLDRGIERAVGALDRVQARHAADGDVVDHHRRVLRQRRDVGQLHGDLVRTGAVALSARHVQRVQATELATGEALVSLLDSANGVFTPSSLGPSPSWWQAAQAPSNRRWAWPGCGASAAAWATAVSAPIVRNAAFPCADSANTEPRDAFLATRRK